MKHVGNPCSKQNPKQCDGWSQRRSNDLSRIARKQPQDAVRTRDRLETGVRSQSKADLENVMRVNRSGQGQKTYLADPCWVAHAYTDGDRRILMRGNLRF